MCESKCQPTTNATTLEAFVEEANTKFVAAVTGARKQHGQAVMNARMRKLSALQDAAELDQDRLDVVAQCASEQFQHDVNAANLQLIGAVERAEVQAYERFASVLDFFDANAIALEEVRREFTN